ncbi:hypothetical protein [Streptomyces anandii]|uniref:hypothetical protein n=1 Tax=Streptomyces anandii TaxID=285454 RepID=UPI0037BA29B9
MSENPAPAEPATDVPALNPQAQALRERISLETRRDWAAQIRAIGATKGWSTWAAEYMDPDVEFVDVGMPSTREIVAQLRRVDRDAVLGVVEGAIAEAIDRNRAEHPDEEAMRTRRLGMRAAQRIVRTIREDRVGREKDTSGGRQPREGESTPAAELLRVQAALLDLHPKTESPTHGCCVSPKICSGHRPECRSREHELGGLPWPCKTLRAAGINNGADAAAVRAALAELHDDADGSRPALALGWARSVEYPDGSDLAKRAVIACTTSLGVAVELVVEGDDRLALASLLDAEVRDVHAPCPTLGCGTDDDCDPSDPALLGWARLEVAGAGDSGRWYCSPPCISNALARAGEVLAEADARAELDGGL